MLDRLLILLVALSLSIVAIPAFGSHGPTDDHDEDSLPDLAELVLCSSEGLRETVINPVTGAAGVGGCESAEDYQPNQDPTPEPPGANDTDEDQIPDALEPAICRFEITSIDDDGSCDPDGQDYTPPEGAPDGLGAFCAVVNATNGLAGTCNDQNEWTPPAGPDGTPSHHALMCGEESGEGLEDPTTDADGSCTYGDEGSTYSAPPVPGPDDLPIPDDVPGPDDLPIPDDVPGPDDLPIPEDPPGPGGLHCSGYDDVALFLQAILSDADCDGDSNNEEIEAGCDPTDEASNLDDGCEGSPVPDLPPEPPEELHCSGYGPENQPDMLVFAILSDADCDGRANHEDDAPLDPDA